MIALADTTALLLCAGLSRRFGPGNKLLAPLNGLPLVCHPAQMLAALPFECRLAVTPHGEEGTELRDLLRAHGYAAIDNEQPEAGKDHSLRLGIEAALKRGARAVLVCLGDMPAITRDHIHALGDAADDDHAAISAAEDWRSPPVLIPAEIAHKLVASPERSIRASLADAVMVHTGAAILADYDSPADFSRKLAS